MSSVRKEALVNDAGATRPAALAWLAPGPRLDEAIDALALVDWAVGRAVRSPSTNH